MENSSKIGLAHLVGWNIPIPKILGLWKNLASLDLSHVMSLDGENLREISLNCRKLEVLTIIGCKNNLDIGEKKYFFYF